MNTKEAKDIVNSIDNLHYKTTKTDADTVIVQVQDKDRNPRNFYPDALAELLAHDEVFDAWVEDNKFYIQLN